MKNVKRNIAIILSSLMISISGTAFAGDAAMHMDFYLKDKLTKQTMVVENIDLIRAQSIQAPIITSKVEQQAVITNYTENNFAQPKRVFQQQIYSVRAGDTLIKISRKTGVEVLELARLNQIKFKDLNHIQVGQKLKLI